MSRYKNQWLAIIASMALGLLSMSAVHANGTGEVALKAYDNFSFPVVGQWSRRVIGWRVEWTCNAPTCTFNTFNPTDSRVCPNGAKIFLLHGVVVYPTACLVT